MFTKRLKPSTEAALYLDAQRAWYGDVLLERVYEAFDRIIEYPEIGAPASRRTRRYPLHQFRYTIIYQIRTDAIFVVAVAHDSRRPNYWAKRLRDNARP